MCEPSRQGVPGSHDNGGFLVPSNWKLDTIIKTLGDAGHALPAHAIAEKLPGISPKQLSNYIKHNVLHKYVTVTRVPIHGDSSAPWLNFYELTGAGIDYYNRKLKEAPQ